MRAFVLLLVVLAAVLVPALAETAGEAVDDFLDSFKNIEIFKISPLACPVAVIGQRCPDANPLFYFKCCGDLNASCCFRLQDWTMVLLVVLAFLIVLSIVVNLVRCLCCY